MAASPVTTNGNNTLKPHRRYILVAEDVLAPTPKIGKQPTEHRKHGKCRIRTSDTLCGTPEEVLNSRYLLETPQDRIERADKMDAWNAICLAPSASKACKGCSLPCKDIVFRLVGTPGLYICNACIWRSTEPQLTDSNGFLDKAVAESFEETRKLCYGDWVAKVAARTTKK